MLFSNFLVDRLAFDRQSTFSFFHGRHIGFLMIKKRINLCLAMTITGHILMIQWQEHSI